jgi:hypothetical protein
MTFLPLRQAASMVRKNERQIEPCMSFGPAATARCWLRAISALVGGELMLAGLNRTDVRRKQP